MARLPRVVVADVAHHVTQRGNARQVIFSSDADRVTYLELLQDYSQLYGLSLLGYCLMSNRARDRYTKGPRGAVAISETGAWTLCRVLECSAVVDRPRMAGTILFLPPGRVPSVESAALCRVESGARGDGGEGGNVEMVERGGALRRVGLGPDARNGALEQALDGSGVAGIYRRCGIGRRCLCAPPLYAHGASVGEPAFRGGS